MKTSALAAAALTLLSLGVAAIPVQAASLATCSTSVPVDGNEDLYIRQLADRGVTAESVEAWGTCLNAFVVRADGSTGIAVFDPATLQQVAGDNAATLG